VTVKEQYQLLLTIAGEEQKEGNHMRAQQVLECAASLQDFWMDIQTDVLLDFTDNKVPTIKSIQKISSDYGIRNQSKTEVNPYKK
jgi:hypothetical protein